MMKSDLLQLPVDILQVILRRYFPVVFTKCFLLSTTNNSTIGQAVRAHTVSLAEVVLEQTLLHSAVKSNNYIIINQVHRKIRMNF